MAKLLGFQMAFGLVLIGCFFVVDAGAETITFRFTGKITFVSPELGETAKIGDGCTVLVTFDPQTEPVFAGLSRYPVLESSFTIEAGEGNLTARSIRGPQEWIIVNDRMGAFQTDQWLWGAVNADGRGGSWDQFEVFSLGGFEILDYNIHLTDNSATAFSSGALPKEIDLSHFGLRQGFAQFGSSGHDVRFSVDDSEILGEVGGASETVTAVKIDSFSLNANGGLTFSWQAVIGSRYQLIRSENLVDWSPFDEVTASEELTSFTIGELSSDSGQGYFAVQSLE